MCLPPNLKHRPACRYNVHNNCRAACSRDTASESVTSTGGRVLLQGCCDPRAVLQYSPALPLSSVCCAFPWDCRSLTQCYLLCGICSGQVSVRSPCHCSFPHVYPSWELGVTSSWWSLAFLSSILLCGSNPETGRTQPRWRGSWLGAPCTLQGVGGCWVRACGAGQLFRAHVEVKALICGAQPQAPSALLSLSTSVLKAPGWERHRQDIDWHDFPLSRLGFDLPLTIVSKDEGMSVPFKGPTSPPCGWSLFPWKHTLGALALWRLWALCVGDLFTGLVMLFRCWFLFFLSFFLVCFDTSSFFTCFYICFWEVGAQIYRKKAPVLKGEVWAHHLTAHHPFDRNAQGRGRGEEVSSEQLDFSVVFAC